MTTSRAVHTEIENLLAYLLDSQIALTTNPVVNYDGRVTWPARGGSPLPAKKRMPTLSDYRSWLGKGVYSAVLLDGALIQLTYDYAAINMLTGHRLAYVPCPFNVDHELLNELPFEDVMDLYSGDSADNVLLSSTVRFDYDAGRAGVGHPAAHLTFNTPSCRIACAEPMRLGRFVEFVFRNFYPHLWSIHPYLGQVSSRALSDRTITEDEAEGPHVMWARR